MNDIRVLVGNEPRAYRETMAEALRCLRPHLDVAEAEPDDLVAAIDRGRPALVFCSDPTPLAGVELLAWVSLYPEGTGKVRICVAGVERVADDMGFDGLLDVVDETERLVRSG